MRWRCDDSNLGLARGAWVPERFLEAYHEGVQASGYGSTAYRDVTISSDSTAMVVTAKYGVLFSPSGRKALPYWKKRIGHRSFCQASKGRQSCPSRPPKMRTKRSVFLGLGSTIVEKKMRLPTRHP